MFLFGRLNSRDKEISIEISKFIKRQLFASCDTVDYEKNWKNRILNPFTYGYYLGFGIKASHECINSNEFKYRIKFIQSIFDELKGSCDSIIDKYIRATLRVIHTGDRKMSENLKKGIEKYLPGVEMFCCGIHAGNDDLIDYVNRTSSAFQLKKYMLAGEYDNSDIDTKLLRLDIVKYDFAFK